MPLVDLLPTLCSLSREEKLRLSQLLALELAQDQYPDLIPAGVSHSLWSPDRSYDAVTLLLEALDAADGRQHRGAAEKAKFEARTPKLSVPS